MNTFSIYKGENILLHIICSNLPKEIEKFRIYSVLDNFSKVDYTLDVIYHNNKYEQIHDHDMSVEDFVKFYKFV